MATTIKVEASQSDPEACRDISVTRYSLGVGNGSGMQLTVGDSYVLLRTRDERHSFFMAMRELGFLSGDWGE